MDSAMTTVGKAWPAFDSAILKAPQSKCKYVTATRKLGDGNFSVVKECMNVQTHERYAMKLIPKKLVRGRMQLIQREVSVLKHVSERIHILEAEDQEWQDYKVENNGTFDGHHHVLQLFDYFETKQNIVLVTQLCAQGDLYDRIIESGSLNLETQVKPYTACLLSALEFLHENGFIHRDIKAENILFRLRQQPPTNSKYDEAAHDLIIADFGLAVAKDNHMSLKEYVGTLSYLAPEVVHCKDVQKMSPKAAQEVKEYGPGIDVWALGVLCYFMMSGYMPFDCDDDTETTDCILRGEYYVDEEAQLAGDLHFKNCWNFIQRCFTVADTIRPSAHDLMAHPFVREYFQSVEEIDFSNIPIIEKSKSSTSLHNLGPPTRSPLGHSPRVSFIEKSPISRNSSREQNLKVLRDTLRKTLSMTSIEPLHDILSSASSAAMNSNRKNSTFILEPEPPSSSLMQGCFSLTPESKSNFSTPPAISRRSSANNFLDTGNTTMISTSSGTTALQMNRVGDAFVGERGKYIAFQLGRDDDDVN
ncbi:protein kinase TDA1 Ecym_4773 [Eremothecium cymbalariae DBVPG|uniref:Protein kinase domain-containing protein n=1 Tax=Eremothecium cymbalariae (strain CBS 270.75 / DBVPG 7215 / KCTC 17166 / NRRL Y-17582) TaxID=931890 RepID=G8JSR3_ERECY|nr:hypothetical protein Ecym_4773 [Eremothecium cymbalariae DBVPG\